MGQSTTNAESVGEAYLSLLADRGIDYLFGNSGTDFPSIIEALAKAGGDKTKAPIPVTVPHENLAVAMAHGYYAVTGRPQAVMFHVNVGTANGITGVLNAARDNVPILFTAGRTPINESGARGARSVFIHWGQEMFDQAGMLREAVKWDYELRNAGQLESVVDRALSLAMTEPRGPVYLSLPREVLAEEPEPKNGTGAGQGGAATAPAPDPEAISRAAEILADAENPVIVTASVGRDPVAFAKFSELAERFALPVVSYRPRCLCLASDHPMHVGFEPAPFVKDADAILVLDCDVPWIPSLHPVNPKAKVILMGADPLFSSYPIRSFPADLAITAASPLALLALIKAMEGHENAAKGRIAARREKIANLRGIQGEQLAAARAASAESSPMSAPWLAHCLDQVKGADDIVVSEAQLPIAHMSFTKHGTYYGTPPAGGLGWGLGAALGVKLGAPDRTVISVVGDGSYMFGGPTPAHYVSASMGLPLLTVILNNSMWGSVRKATLGLYPDGAAAKSNRAPLTYFDPVPEYHKVVEASGGYGEKVETPGDLPAALDRALAVVKGEGRQAVLNVITSYADSQALADARR